MSEDSYYCEECDEGPFTSSGVKVHQSTKHGSIDYGMYEGRDVSEIESEVSDEVLKKFIKVRDMTDTGRVSGVGEALVKLFEEKDGKIFYYTSKQISEDTGDILSPRQISKGLRWLSEQSSGKLIDVERWSNNTPSKWRIEI